MSLFNIKEDIETKIPSIINYIIVLDGYALPMMPARIQRSLRGREEQSYQQGVGGYVQRVYVPGLEEVQMDLYLPKVLSTGMTTQQSAGMQYAANWSSLDFSEMTSYTSLTNPVSMEFFNGMWLDIAKNPTIVGQNAIIDKLMVSAKLAVPINIVIERVQGTSGTNYNMGMRLLTSGRYVVSAIDVHESSESAMWSIVSISLTEYKLPKPKFVGVADAGGELLSNPGVPMPIDTITNTGEENTEISNTTGLTVGASPRQLAATMAYRLGSNMLSVLGRTATFMPRFFF
jgi:hypothetical protein